MNDIIEQNMRRIVCSEKETQFLKKKLSEAENLNMKMMSELNDKTKVIDDLNRKNFELMFILFNLVNLFQILKV